MMTPLQKGIFTAEHAENAEIFCGFRKDKAESVQILYFFSLCALRVLGGKWFLQWTHSCNSKIRAIRDAVVEYTSSPAHSVKLS